MMEDTWYVRRDEVFAVSDTDNDRRPVARGDDFVGLIGGDNADGISTSQTAGGAAHGLFERHGLAGIRGRSDLLLDEVGDDFCIRLSYKPVTLEGKLMFQGQIVFDDTVVDDDDAASTVAVRVRVFFGRTAMRGPTRVADAIGSGERTLPDDFFEVAKLAWSAAQRQPVAIAPYGNTG